nr:protein kinase superfamily protein [Tanacetum cinerariifolium]
MSNISKIAVLALDKTKLDLMEGSVLEIAKVLGIEDKGISYEEYTNQCSSLSAEFPQYLWDLKHEFDKDDKKGKRIAKEGDKKEKMNAEKMNASATLWPKRQDSAQGNLAVKDHMDYSFERAKEWVEAGRVGQHSFSGAAPVLEAILFERMPDVRPDIFSAGILPIELGQALSTRPDILPFVYRTELAKLHVAICSIETQLGAPISQLFVDISPKPMATSLGKVYKAHLHTGELVAVKVQRPGMWLSLTVDALLFNMIGGQLKRFAKARKDRIVAVNEMVRRMFDEIDYIHEGQNCERFASLYGFRD